MTPEEREARFPQHYWLTGRASRGCLQPVADGRWHSHEHR